MENGFGISWQTAPAGTGVQNAIASVNPSTGETLKQFEPLSDAQLEDKLQRADSAYSAYRRLSFAERARMMRGAAGILESEKDKFGRIMTAEMGKSLRAAIEEVAKCALGCRYYADHAERFLADELVETPGMRSYIRYQPLGPILAVMPWNFPFWQVFRFAAPALMAGNVVLLKHASDVPRSALNIEKNFFEAGFPPGGFQTLFISSQIVKQIVHRDLVAAGTLTGSERAV